MGVCASKRNELRNEDDEGSSDYFPDCSSIGPPQSPRSKEREARGHVTCSPLVCTVPRYACQRWHVGSLDASRICTSPVNDLFQWKARFGGKAAATHRMLRNTHASASKLQGAAERQPSDVLNISQRKAGAAEPRNRTKLTVLETTSHKACDKAIAAAEASTEPTVGFETE